MVPVLYSNLKEGNDNSETIQSGSILSEEHHGRAEEGRETNEDNVALWSCCARKFVEPIFLELCCTIKVQGQ